MHTKRFTLHLGAAAIGAILAIVVVAMPLVATAQSSRYEKWRQDGGEADKILNQLQEMIDEAERTRAADPRFLSDLRSLLRHRDDSRSVSLLNETFADGDFTRNPAWTVASGRFEVSRQGGLLSDVSTYSQRSRKTPDRKLSKEEIASYLLATLLNRRWRGETSGSGNRYDRGPAEIYLPLRIPNAFSIQANFSASGKNGAFEFRIYQGKQRLNGYALAYSERTGLALLRRHRGSDETVIEATRPARDLLDGTKHRIEWHRKRNGEMIVRINKKEVMRLVDNSFRDPFEGIRMLNGGGRQVLFALRVKGEK